MKKISTASKILIVASLLYLIDLFLPWQRVCFGGGSFFGVNVPGACGSVSGLHGIGIINLLLVLALLAEEGMKVFGVKMPPTMPMGTIVLGLAGGLVVFTILKVIVDHQAIYFFTWIGLILALAIGYGGYMRFQESKAAGPPPMAPPPPPGMTT